MSEAQLLRVPCPHCGRLNRITPQLDIAEAKLILRNVNARAALWCHCDALLVPDWVVADVHADYWSWRIVGWMPRKLTAREREMLDHLSRAIG